MTYPQNPTQMPTYAGAPQPPKKKRRIGLILGIGAGSLVLFCAIGAIIIAASSGDDPGTGGGAPGAGANDAGRPAVGLNQAARDGKFEFTVTKVECGIPQIGADILNQKAQGQYCKVATTVKNIGDEARTFESSYQFAYNGAGQKYNVDATASLYLEDNGNSFLTNINPGNTVNGTIVFDIPKGASITKLELHDSAMSGGVTVNMT